MSKLLLCLFFLLLMLGPASTFSAQAQQSASELAQGIMAGEVSSSSVILQARLTADHRLPNADVPGVAGVARFELSESENFTGSRFAPWIEATPDGDYIIKQVVRGLQPGARYYYRLEYGPDRTSTRRSEAGTFRTHSGPAGDEEIRLAVGSCMHFSRHFYGDDGAARPSFEEVTTSGFDVFNTIRAQEPDFYFGVGDNVYYDHPIPGEEPATTLPSMRVYWHRQFAVPSLVALLRSTGSYWMKDDHDFRFNDADTTQPDLAPGTSLGIRVFREQVPVVDPDEAGAKTYRTYRFNRHIQVWMVEGRDYRSPNAITDGMDKSVWGDEQEAWLKRTLLASDATFKIIIHPTPLVGPDDAYKVDNHTNPGGFQYERDAFFGWLKEFGLIDRNTYIVTGDRHWQYHSIHPEGIEEFSAGALNDENSRYGVPPGAPRSTDPASMVKQPFLQNPPTGGFLIVRAATAADAAELHFTFYDDVGDTLYTAVKRARLGEPTTGRQVNLVPQWTRPGDDQAVADQERGTVSVESAELSPDGELIVSGSKGRVVDDVRKGQAIKLWTVDRGAEIWSRNRANEVEAVAFSPAGDVVAAGGEDALVEILAVRDADGRVMDDPEVVAVLEHHAPIDGLRFSHDGRFLVTGDECAHLHVFRTSDWQEIGTARATTGESKAINQIDFSADDSLIATADGTGDVKIWELASEEGPEDEARTADLRLIRTFDDHTGSVKSVRFSPDGNYVAAGADDSSGVRIWTIGGDLVAHISATGGTMEAIEWSPDGRYLFTGGTEGRDRGGIGNIRAYDRLQNFAPVMAEQAFRQEYLHISRDGRYLVSSHEDGTLRLWEVVTPHFN